MAKQRKAITDSALYESIWNQMQGGVTRTDLVDNGFTEEQIVATLEWKRSALLNEIADLTPEMAYADWLLAKAPIINMLSNTMRTAAPRDGVAAANLLNRIIDDRFDRALAVGIIKPNREGNDTIAMTDSEIALRVQSIMLEIATFDGASIIDIDIGPLPRDG
jgi:hypothetical protein